MTSPTVLGPPLGTPLARVLLIAFAVVHALLAIGPGPTPPALTILALATIVGAAAIVVLAEGRGLTRVQTVATVLLTVAGTAVVIPLLPDDGWPGYASWPLGAGAFIAVGVALRGRIAAAWVLIASMAALCLLWAARGGASPLAGVGLIDRHIGILLLGTLFAIGLGRTARTHDAFVEVQRAEMLELDLAEAELAARQEVVQRVLDDAGPVLQRIAGGRMFDDAERAEIAAVEGHLRDEITLAPIRSETLDHALEAARRRGVDVLVLTDPAVEHLPTPMRLRAAAWLASQLDRARGEEFVGRVVTRGQDVRVSATVDERIEDRIIGDRDA